MGSPRRRRSAVSAFSAEIETGSLPTHRVHASQIGIPVRAQVRTASWGQGRAMRIPLVSLHRDTASILGGVEAKRKPPADGARARTWAKIAAPRDGG